MDAPTTVPTNPLPFLTFESTTTRRRIIAAYFVVIFLALPLWWVTTSIERQSLPSSRVFLHQGKELVFPVHVDLDSTNYRPAEESSLAQAVQQSLQSHPDLREPSGLRVHVSSGHKLSGAYQVLLGRGDQGSAVEDRELSVQIHPDEAESTAINVVAMQLADTLATLLSPYTTLRSSQAEHAVKYAPRYRLAFTLLNEDATSENAALSWNIRNAISKHIQPVIDKLSVLHNFTVESQVQFHAPLAFEPHTIEVNDGTEYALTQEDLTVFVNSAEWTLSSSVSNDPVLQFIVFVPSSKHHPLRIIDNNGLPTSSNAFILPQWGGIVLYNPPSPSSTQYLSGSTLDAVFAIFRYQLTTLLGVPPLPAHIRSHHSYRDGATFSGWQLDALLRRRASENTENAHETLQSIVRLVTQIENMPVGQDVKNDVQEALAALDEAFTAASSSLTLTLRHAGRAATLASRAFFNPGMLALLYFPAEHKYAVYAPLFASIAAPLASALVREFTAWRKARRLAKEESEIKQKVD